MNLALEHWHIEVSSICTLKCSRCTRSELPEGLLNRQLDLKFFKNQIGDQRIREMRKISFCGADGDPIYCKEFLEILEYIKILNPNISITIITNGSYKSVTWWEKLAGILNEHDELHWSVDGWDQESNNKYRTNCDWSSIILGMQTFRECNNSTYTVIDSIGFSFNENDLKKIKQVAIDHNLDCWQLTKSTLFGSVYPHKYGDNDPLEPINKNLIASGFRYEREQTVLTNRTRPGLELKDFFWKKAVELQNSNEYPALCYVGNKGVFVNSRGDFFPCCWTATRHEHNNRISTLAKTKFNLHNHTLDTILNDDYWQTEFKKFDNLECKTRCIKSKLYDKSYVTEW